MLSKLSGSTVTDTIRTAIENHLEVLANDPTITAKAKELTAEIDKEAELQRQAFIHLEANSAPEGDHLVTAPRGATASLSHLVQFHRGNNPLGWTKRLMAEDRGFEPLRACTQPAFQASAIGH